MREESIKLIGKKLKEYTYGIHNFKSNDSTRDVPDVDDDKEYVTNLPAEQSSIVPPKKKRQLVIEPPPLGAEEPESLKILTKKIKDPNNRVFKFSAEQASDDEWEKTKDEQGSEMPGEEEAPQDQGDMTGGDTSAGMTDQGMGQDPSMGMGGMYGEEPPKTPQEIGRIFELKKIYARLVSIESYLSFSSDIVLQKLRTYVVKAIELFETLISNVDSFKDQVDEIIVTFYQFLEDTFVILNKYYKIKSIEDKKNVKLGVKK